MQPHRPARGPRSDLDSGAYELLFRSEGPVAIVGTSGADEFSGGLGRDVLWGEGDHDLLIGGRGADICRGGGGQDVTRKCETISP
jgi:Ca2+-binding RTX toxin-like protein